MTSVTASNLGKDGRSLRGGVLTCSHRKTSHRLLFILWKNPILEIGTWWRFIHFPVSGLNEVDKQRAIITFERPSAARTALLLQDAHLGTSQVHVSSFAPLDGASTPPSAEKSKPETDFNQEDKPRTAVVAGSSLPYSQTHNWLSSFRILVPRLHSYRPSIAKSNRLWPYPRPLKTLLQPFKRGSRNSPGRRSKIRSNF